MKNGVKRLILGVYSTILFLSLLPTELLAVCCTSGNGSSRLCTSSCAISDSWLRL